MYIEEGLKTELSSIVGLDGKIFPLTAEQGTQAPYLVYLLNSTDREKNLLGYDGLIGATYEINVYNTTYANLKALKKLIVDKLKSLELKKIALTGPYVEQLDILTDFEKYENESILYCGIIEFEIYYNED